MIIRSYRIMVIWDSSSFPGTVRSFWIFTAQNELFKDLTIWFFCLEWHYYKNKLQILRVDSIHFNLFYKIIIIQASFVHVRFCLIRQNENRMPKTFPQMKSCKLLYHSPDLQNKLLTGFICLYECTMHFGIFKANEKY